MSDPPSLQGAGRGISEAKGLLPMGLGRAAEVQWLSASGVVGSLVAPYGRLLEEFTATANGSPWP